MGHQLVPDPQPLPVRLRLRISTRGKGRGRQPARGVVARRADGLHRAELRAAGHRQVDRRVARLVDRSLAQVDLESRLIVVTARRL